MSFHPNMNPNSLVNAHVSKLAQDSLREVRRLRIVLTRLLANVSTASEEDSDGVEDSIPESEANSKRNATAANRANLTASPVLGAPDGKLTTETSDSQPGQSTHTAKKDHLNENLQPHRLVAQIRDCFESLDELARYMRNSRLRSCMGDLGLHNALSLITTVDQLEFPTPSTEATGEEDGESGSLDEMRRADWLTDRWDAERWSNRYCERTHTILEGLLACSMFQRSHLNSEQKRRNRESLINSTRDVRFDLECLLNDIHAFSPKLTITLVGSSSNLSVVHVKVGDVMQCLITFRRLHPERIIVRGLTESCLIHQGNKPTAPGTPAPAPDQVDREQISKPMEELLNSKLASNAAIRDTLVSLLSTEPKLSRSDQDLRARRGPNPAYNPRPIQVSTFHVHQLDLVTPSRHTLFQRITALAQCALLHLSNDYQPDSAVRGLFAWLHSYHDLFTAPCSRCNQLLGQDVGLPLWRSYSQSRKGSEQRSIERQHEYCQAIS